MNQQEYDIDPDLYFSDADFTSAKQLESMMPIRRWMLIARLQVRRSIRTLVYDLADQFHKVRAESPGDGRTKRQSAVVARMRMLAFAGYPMIPELMRAHRVGGRIAAIAFLQVRPDYKTSALVWLGERVSSREQQLVQYHAAGALLVACRNAEERDLKTLCEVMKTRPMSARKWIQKSGQSVRLSCLLGASPRWTESRTPRQTQSLPFLMLNLRGRCEVRFVKPERPAAGVKRIVSAKAFHRGRLVPKTDFECSAV